MPDTFLFANNATSTLAAGITVGATSLFLATGDGALFPSPAAGQRFAVTLEDASGNREICYCSARSGDTLTVARAQEGTAAFAFSAGDKVELRFTKGNLAQIPQMDGNVQTDLNADKWDGGDKTISTGTPSGGADGDVWFQVSP